MAGTGPARKPDAIRRRHPRVVDIRAHVVRDAPHPPPGLLKATREWWTEFWVSELATVTTADTDRPAVERLATLYDLRRRAYRSVKSEPLVDGSQGQKVLNPLARQMASWDAEIRQLEDRFGLTPRSRLNLGLQLGAAKKQLEDLNWSVDDDDAGPGDAAVVVDI